MTAAKKEIIFGLVFVAAYALLSHFVRSAARVSVLIFGIFVVSPIVLNVYGWWRWRGVRSDEGTPRWRKIAGLSGLVADTSAVCLAWLSFFYSILVENTHRQGFRGIDPYPAFVACLVLSVAALAIGVVAPRRIRLAVVLGGFTMSWLILLMIGSAGVL
jgi:nicotinamide riboside transporter PnuC